MGLRGPWNFDTGTRSPRNARFLDVGLHRSLLRPGVSLRQGVPEVEVTHAHRHDHRRRARPIHPAAWLPGHNPALPGEVLT